MQLLLFKAVIVWNNKVDLFIIFMFRFMNSVFSSVRGLRRTATYQADNPTRFWASATANFCKCSGDGRFLLA